MELTDYLDQEFIKWSGKQTRRDRKQVKFAEYCGITKQNMSNYMSGTRKPDRDNCVLIALALNSDIIFDLSPAFDNEIPGELGQRFKKAEIEFNKEVKKRNIAHDSQEAIGLVTRIFEQFGLNSKSIE